MKAEDIPLNRLYSELAWLWPTLSPPEDYAEEATHWRALLEEKLGPGRHAILELGVGGGHNLSHIADGFDAAAVDVSAEMIEHSQRLNPGVEHHVGDMRSVRLGRTFDAVLIHDAISYIVSETDLKATMRTAAVHLQAGGILIMAPDYVKETFSGGSVRCKTRTGENFTLTRLEYEYDPDPNDSTYVTLFTHIIRRGGAVEIEHDRHVLGLFGMTTWLTLMDRAGFDAERRDYPVHEDARQGWLLVGRKR